MFSCIVSFVYTNSCELSEEVVGELLHTADMFLLPGLKKLCGKMLAKLVDMDNVLDFFVTARLFNLARLEDLCTEFISRNIEQVGFGYIIDIIALMACCHNVMLSYNHKIMVS